MSIRVEAVSVAGHAREVSLYISFRAHWKSIFNLFSHLSFSFSLFLSPAFPSRFDFPVPPMMMIQNQLVGAAIGQPANLECSLEAFPRSINYWKSKNGSIIAAGMYDISIQLIQLHVVMAYISNIAFYQDG